MRICYANNYLSPRGGAERVMFEDAALMRKAGHEVSFFGCRGSDDIEWTHAAFYPPHVVLESISGIARWRQAGRVVYNPANRRAFKRFLDAVRPDLIHAHNLYGGLTTAVLDAARDAQLPVVLTVHDYKLVCPSYLALDHGKVCTACRGGRFHHCLTRRCHKSSFAASLVYTAEAFLTAWGRKYATVRRFLCPSRFIRDSLLDNGFAPARLIHVPNAIDASGITPSAGDGACALYVGRLSHEKGVRTLLRALEGLDLPLRIAGDGPLRPELEAEVRRRGLRDRVAFAGHLSGEALTREYRNAAFVVLPSEWLENAPMSILEAFAHGKPVVGADIGGIPELVEPEQTGLLFPSGDADALRAAMQALWRDSAARRDLGQAARHRVDSDLSPARHAQALQRVYDEALGACRT